MRIGIINIGDELLAGKILNSNQYELSRMLTPLGHEVAFSLVIGDSTGALANSLKWILGGSDSGTRSPKVDILVLTGGLGPTQDDLTRQAVASFFGWPVREDQAALGWLCDFLGKSTDSLPKGQRVQATVPEGAEALRNPAGTACGFRIQIHGVQVLAFPGVPAELKAMAEQHLLPVLTQDHILLEKGAWTFGWSEGSQRQAFAKLVVPEPFRFSSLPNEQGVRLSLSCVVPFSSQASRKAELDVLWDKLIAAIPAESLVDAYGASLSEVIMNLLLARMAKVSVAESCTGGGLGALITETAGSSGVFEKGYLTYSNQAKCELLGVKSELLDVHGAVSEAAAKAMAEGCLIRSGADYACAITGIAGPGGGSPEKPVGTVWIGIASRRSLFARKFQFRGNRSAVRSRSCYTALNLLRLLILEDLPQS